MTTKQKNALEQELASIVNEVSEVLKKSGVLAKDDDQIGDVPPEHAEPDADNMGGPSDQDADNVPAEGEAPATPVEGDPSAAPAPAEGGEGDEASEMASHAAELSDEELESMLQVLMAEVEKRHAGQAGAEGAAPAAEGAPAPQAAPAPEPMAASMKAEFAGLAKSVAEIAEAVKGLTGEVGTLKKSVSEKKSTVIVGKPAAANQSVQVLQKSAEPKMRLSKSDTTDYLLSEQRNGNKRVNSDMIAGVNACRSEEDLAKAQNDIEKLGIKLP
jgi:hypothetical protein